MRLGPRVVAAPHIPETVAVSADGTRIATAGALGDAVEVFDPAGNILLRADTAGRPVRVAFGPDGTIAAALSAEGAVALVDARGRFRRVTVGGMPDGLLFDGDGQVLYVSDLETGRLMAHLEFVTGVEEIFDVQVVQGARCPALSGPYPSRDSAKPIWTPRKW